MERWPAWSCSLFVPARAVDLADVTWPRGLQAFFLTRCDRRAPKALNKLNAFTRLIYCPSDSNTNPNQLTGTTLLLPEI